MKKLIVILIVIGLLAGAFSACAGAPAAQDPDKLQIVTTIFPVYDWVREVLGSRSAGAEITMLLDNGVDLHSYQPTADDLVKISNCDLLIYVGGESDAWVADALRGAANADMVVIDLITVLGDAVKNEQTVAGMEGEEAGAGDEADEHIWLSLRNASCICGEIAERFGDIDRENAAEYQANATAYIEKLDALDLEYQTVVDTAKQDTLLFCDRFPFRYLTDDYGLSYYAAFSGCSAETEASFETVAFLANTVDALGLTCVLTIEGSQHKIAETVILNTASKDQTILTLNSMQSVTSRDVAQGVSYLSIMEDNLSVLRQALN